MIEAVGSIFGIALAIGSLFAVCRESFDAYHNRRISRLVALQESEKGNHGSKTAPSYIDAELLKLRNDYLRTMYDKDRAVPRFIRICYCSSLIFVLLAFLYAGILPEDQWGRSALIGLPLSFGVILLFLGLILLSSESKPLGLWLETVAHKNWSESYMQIRPLTPEQLKLLHDVQFIDIRSKRESTSNPWPGAIHVPYCSGRLRQRIEVAIAGNMIQKTTDTVVIGISHYYCNIVAAELYRSGVTGELMIAGQLDSKTSSELFPIHGSHAAPGNQ